MNHPYKQEGNLEFLRPDNTIDFIKQSEVSGIFLHSPPPFPQAVFFYYLDRSVQLENTPLVKSILHPGPGWRIFHILTSEDQSEDIGDAIDVS